MDVKTWAERTQVNLKGVLQVAQEHTEQAKNFGWVDEDEKGFTVFVMALGQGRWGNDQKFHYTARFFGIDSDGFDTCEDWPHIEAAAEEVAEYFTAEARKVGMKGLFYFGHNEADGDFDLFYKEAIENAG